MKAIPVALLVAVSLTLFSLSQNSRSIPPQMVHAQELRAQTEIGSQPRAPDPAALQNEARQLATLAASIPPDLQNVNKGLMSKDLIQKLKQIEKLSKQLRSGLAH
ncbi:MAG TPA: hypothetical protein VGG04_01245 [Candidatus Sulfotelmatobacter sp.]